jgi:hypothetical protein
MSPFAVSLSNAYAERDRVWIHAMNWVCKARRHMVKHAKEFSPGPRPFAQDAKVGQSLLHQFGAIEPDENPPMHGRRSASDATPRRWRRYG